MSHPMTATYAGDQPAARRRHPTPMGGERTFGFGYSANFEGGRNVRGGL
jgi:hypothetical protein